MEDIDRLEIEVEASASKASSELDKLIGKLEKVANSLSGIQRGDLAAFANGVERLGRSMQSVNSVKTTDFTRLAKGLNKLNEVDIQGVSNASRAISTLSANLSQIGMISIDGQGIADLANSISKFGYETIGKAAENIPKITAPLTNLISGLNSVGTVKFDLAGLANLVSSITKLGSKSVTQSVVNISQITQPLVDFIAWINGLQAVTFDMAGLSSLISSISKLGGKMATTATANLPNISRDLQAFISGLNQIGAVRFDLTGISDLVSSVTKLGGKAATNAIPNIQKLGSALKELMTTLSAAPTVNQNIIQMTNALANLSNSIKGIRLGGVGSAAGKSASGVQRLSAAFSKLSGRAMRSGRSMKNFSQFAGKFYADCFIAIRGLKKLGNAIEASMDYVETYNYFSVTMDKIGTEFADMYEQYGYDSAEAYANSFSGRLNELIQKMTGYSVGSNGELLMTDSVGLGLDPEVLMNFQSKIGAVTNAVGLYGETSVNTADALSRLAADMSSFTNTDLESVMTNLQSGLIGQSRAMYKYGIDITNANLQNYAYAYDVNKAVSEMTQAEKMQLRLLAILDQSKVAWGDQANTLSTASNQYRILKQQISNLARVIGNLFLPIVQKVLPVVNGLIIALQRLFTALGFKLWGGNWLKDTMDGISGGYADDSLGDLSDNADDAAGSLNDAANAAKKLKTTVLGIDELNINAPDDDSAAGAGASAGDTIDLSGAIADAVSDYKSIWDEAFANSQNKVQEYADAITNMFLRVWNAIEPFRNAIVNLWDNGLAKLADFTWTGLKDFYNEFLVPIGMWAFGTEDAGLTRLVNVINEGLMAIHWEELSSSLKNFWAAIEPYAEQFGEGLIDFFEDISGLAVDIINQFPGIFNRIANALNNGDPETARKWGYALGVLATGLMALKGIGTIISGIAGIGTTLLETSKGLGALFGAEGVFAKISGAISGLFAEGGIFGAASFSVSVPMVAAIAAVTLALIDLWNTSEKFQNAVKRALSQIQETFSSAFSGVADGIFGVMNNFNEFLKMVYEIYDNSPLKNLVELIGIFAVKLAELAATAAIKTLGNMIQGFCTILRGAISIVSGFLQVLHGMASLNADEMLSGFKNIGEGIVDIFKGAFKSSLGALAEFVSDWATSIANWWNDHVAPWFTLDRWKELYKSIKDAFKSVWDNVVLWWKTNISRWWNENVAPWFTLERWKTLYTSIKSALKTKWDETVTQWKANISSWWNSHVAPWFTYTKWAGIAINIKNAIIGKLSDMVESWRVKIADWWAKHVEPWFKLSTWIDLLSGIPTAFTTTFKNAINSAIALFNKFIGWINSKMKFKWDDFEIAGQTIVKGGSIQLFTIPKIPTFAQGGYPETGELFVARENGINEMVGRIGNRSAVANNDQIVQAITAGVANGINSEEQNTLLREQNELLRAILAKNMDVTLDGKSLVSGIDKARRRMGWNFQPIQA